jgi:uncharacterized protein (DUF2249 family)
MVSDIDVTDTPVDQARTEIVAALESSEAEDVVKVTAGGDPEPALYQAQITQDRSFTWKYEEDGPDVWVVTARPTGESTAELTEFDVRQLPPQQRHSVLTETFEKLDPGNGFVLVNDHDPKPLYHELRSTHGEGIDWEYRSRESDAWKVEILKTETSASGNEAVAASFDVREIPKQERHPTIHHRYSNLSAGDILELIAPHEPRPLHREFSQQYGDRFEWDVREKEHGRCRVWITKGDADTAESESHDQQSSEELTITDELDVRQFPPAKRHELIFESYEELQNGEGFVLINDHDPKPLYHQFEAEAGAEFRWEYQKKQQGEFRVRIGKSDIGESAGTAAPDFEAPF